MIVRELITRLGFSVDNSALDRVDGRLHRIKGEAESAANAFAAIGAAIAGFAAARGIVAVADMMQSLQARIGMLPQTIGDAAEAFDRVAEHADKARQGITEYTTLYIRLAGATKDYMRTQEDVLLITDAISNALVIGGATAEEAASAMIQLSQGFQKGKLDGDEFKAFMETMSTDFKDKLAAQLDTTTDKLFELSSSGALTARKLAEAFKAMAPEIERDMLKMPLAFGQATQIVGNHWDRLVHRLNRQTMFIPKMAKIIIDAMVAVENGINKVIDVVGGADNAVRLMIATLAALGLMAGVALAPMIAAGVQFAAVAALIALALEDVFTWLQGGESLIGAMIGPWARWKDNVLGTFNAIINVGKSLWRVLEGLWKGDPAALIDGVAQFFTAMRALGDNLAPILLAALSALWDGLKNMASAIMRALITAFVAALQALIDGGIAAAGTIGDALLNAIKGAGSGIWDFFTGGGPTVAPSQMTAQGMGNSAVNQTNNTNVTVQVPAGTNAEQKAHIERSAKAAFSAVQPANPRDLAAHGR
jgi:tape measure domain-containing protein